MDLKGRSMQRLHLLIYKICLDVKNRFLLSSDAHNLFSLREDEGYNRRGSQALHLKKL